VDYFDWNPYVRVAARRRQAAAQLARLKKKGAPVSPVLIEGRKIATTFWGKAWCENLERYSDFSNRLPRGRTYVRNGSVIDLQVAPGTVTALVSGSEIYEVRVDVAAVPKARWRAMCRDCTGAIDSVVELLQGRLSSSVLSRICEPTTGLFPAPKEIAFRCSCPDWAWMCKHVAAVLYGIGARLDGQPELLFRLRRVDQRDLIAKADSGLQPRKKAPAAAKILATEDLSQMFGIEIAPPEPASVSATRRKRGAHDPIPPPTRAKAAGSAANRARPQPPPAEGRIPKAAARTTTRAPATSPGKGATLSARVKQRRLEKRRRGR
jgi:uncharacterized Zn finger protein